MTREEPNIPSDRRFSSCPRVVSLGGGTGLATFLTMAEHIEALVDHSGSLLFPTALVNTHLPSASILRKYEEGNAGVVEIDRQQVADMGVEIVEQDLLSEGGAIRHDPESLAAAVLNI